MTYIDKNGVEYKSMKEFFRVMGAIGGRKSKRKKK